MTSRVIHYLQRHKQQLPIPVLPPARNTRLTHAHNTAHHNTTSQIVPSTQSAALTSQPSSPHTAQLISVSASRELGHDETLEHDATEEFGIKSKGQRKKFAGLPRRDAGSVDFIKKTQANIHIPGHCALIAASAQQPAEHSQPHPHSLLPTSPHPRQLSHPKVQRGIAKRNILLDESVRSHSKLFLSEKEQRSQARKRRFPQRCSRRSRHAAAAVALSVATFGPAAAGSELRELRIRGWAVGSVGSVGSGGQWGGGRVGDTG